MTDQPASIPVTLDLSPAGAEIARATAALEKQLGTAGARAGGALSGAFDNAFAAISRGIERAARTGTLSVRGMVSAIMADLSRLAVRQFVSAPLRGLVGGALGSLMGGLGFGGFRALGGPVTPGRGYVVGERGPELFVPRQPGAVLPHGAGGGAPSVVFNITARDADSFRRAESQLAALAARTLRAGARNL
jgi:phage-related minor tail protein